MNIRVAILASCVVGFSGSAWAAGARAPLKDAQNEQIGTVELEETASGALLVKLTAKGLPAGTHAFHIHEKGACDAAGRFESAGGHLTGGKSHGVLHEGGPHAGDLPNIEVPVSGQVKYETFLPAAMKGPWLAAANVFDADGAAVVVHAKSDDYHSQPAGDAGGRIACGVLQKK